MLPGGARLTTIPFWKVESIGNDFVLIHLEDADRLRRAEPLDSYLERLTIASCHRHFGIGADGLLALGREPEGLTLRMFNPDGSEDFCGNGIRCGFDHALRLGWVAKESMRMRHFGKPVKGQAVDLHEEISKAGESVAERLSQVNTSTRYLIEFELPPASYTPSDIPLDRSREAFDTALLTVDGEVYSGSVLSTGTAHTILPVSRLPDDDLFFRVSPQIERHPMFPERTSVMWVADDHGKLRLRIWERGVGETKGCGSGSTAAAVDYLRRTGGDGRVEVSSAGGVLFVQADSWQAPPRITGTAAERFRGDYSFGGNSASQ